VGFYRRIRAQAGGFLLAGLLMPAAIAAGAPEGGRDLPPVVEMGVDNAPATRPSATREAMADLLQQLETLQAEVRKLRGQIEVQGNEIERLKARQRDLLADMDRRISALEQRNAPGASSAAAPAGAATSTAPAAAAASAQEQQAYDAAFDLMKKGYYERAAKAFRDFNAKYPQSALRDNAQYWLGQAYYVSRNFRQALVEFGKVISDHPGSNKAPDAALKIGYSHYELGEWSKARDSLNQVVTRYPGTPAAKSAEQRLAKMKKEKK